MSPDVVVCPQCGANLQNSEGVAGQVVACPLCQTQLQMPALSRLAPVPQSSSPNALPPAIEHSFPTRVGADANPAFPIPGQIIQAKRPKPDGVPSVTDRLRKRTNPWVIILTGLMVIVLIAVGSASYLSQQAGAARRQFERQLVGNWELVPGQSQLERWDFAFHGDGHLQMALENQLHEGRWKVTSVRGPTGYVLIDWPDDAPQTLRVRLESGTMQVALDGVGNFAFRAAVP